METTDASAALIAIASDWVAAGILGMTRLGAFMQVFALFSTFQLTPFLRGAIALGLSVPLIIAIHDNPAGGPLLDASLALPVAREAIGGLVLGLLLSTPFYMAQAAGDFVDTYRGASQANFVTPGNAEETSESGQIFLFFCMALFVAGGGLQETLSLIYKSYSVVPANTLLPLEPEILFSYLAEVFMLIFGFGLTIGGPLLIALATIDAFFVLMSRSAKNLNMFDLSVGFKNIVLVITLPVYVGFMAMYIDDSWRKIFARAFELMRLE